MRASGVGFRGPGVVLLVAALSLPLLMTTAAGQEPGPQPRPAPALTIQGSGEGHSVGLSQWGARALERAGRTHVEILDHFYTGITVGPHEAAEGVAPIRVGLFHDNPTVEDPTVLAVSALRDDASGGVDVRLAPEGATHRVPAGETWTIEHDDGLPILVPPGFVLRNPGGSSVARGAGPVTISFATTESPALRLPQIATTQNPLEATLLRGSITVTRDAESGHFAPILQLPLNEYLLGIDQIPAAWEEEVLKAQAVVARSFGARRLDAGLREDCGCHVVLDEVDHQYAGFAREAGTVRQRWAEAVTATAGQVVTADGALVETPFATAHGGRSEDSEQSWAFDGQALPHLRTVEDPWVGDPEVAAVYPGAAWSHELDHDVLAELVGLATVTQVGIVSRTTGGTPDVLSVSGWGADGQRVEDRQFAGDAIGVAGADLYLALRDADAPPPSQQFGVIGFTSFPDLPGRSTHAYNVAAIAERGVTTGRADGTYDPRAGVRRDQMATFIARALDLPVDTGAPDQFDDVPAGSTHRAAINAVAARGIAQGVAPRVFAPDATVTRDQMATFIARAFDLGESEQDRFTDIAASVHRTRINAVAERGVTAGCDADSYCPRLPVSRDQMASFLARALGFGW